jgi:protein SCO1
MMHASVVRCLRKSMTPIAPLGRRFCGKSSATKSSVGTPKQNFFRQGPVSWASFTLCMVVCGGALTYFEIQKDKKMQEQTTKVETTGKAAIGGEWTLVKSDGTPVSDASYKGQFSLLYFGFTYCPDICPNELVKIGKIVEELNAGLRSAGLASEMDTDPRKYSLKPVFISVDPARDSLSQLGHYGKDFHASIDWLTGTVDQIADITRAFRVYFSKANQHEDDEEDYLLDHSIVLYLMAPDGSFVEFYTQRMLVSDIVQKMQKQMREYYQQQGK